jgi:hypothetical protein
VVPWTPTAGVTVNAIGAGRGATRSLLLHEKFAAAAASRVAVQATRFRVRKRLATV